MINFKGQKGITLIALVITIIVLLILAGVTIAMITGQDSAPQKAVEAKIENDKGAMKDAASLVATKYVQEYYDKKYVQNEPNFGTTYPNQGAYLKAKLPTETGEYTYSVSGDKLTVTDAKGNTVTGTINDNGTITWDGSSSGGQTAGSKITVNGTDIDLSTLDATTVAQYYGTTVKTINNVEYGLFYVDYAGKYGEAGTIYLRAKSHVGSTGLNGTLSDAKKSTAISIMKKLNPDWARTDARGNVEYSNYYSSEKGAIYLCNPNNSMWSGIGSSFNSSDLNYVIGAPSIEMFLDSYNAKYPDLDTKYTTAYRAAGQNYTYPGYLYSDNGGTNYSIYYASAIQQTADSTVEGMYRNPDARGWLASPLSDNIGNNVCDVYSNGYLYYDYCGMSRGVAPLVSLKSGVDLTN